MTSISALFFRLAVVAGLALSVTVAHAMSFADLSNQEASTGLKAALDKGSAAAIGKLGVENGFLNNEKVKIQLPSILEKARPILQMTGKGQQLDELVVSMNRAAEAAVPMAKPLLVNAVKSMTLTDAKNILTGGETSVTDFFREKTSAPLSAKFLPLVKGVTDKAGLSAKYNGIMGQAQKFGAVSQQEATVEGYVTQKAMDALFLMIAEEEKSIRQDPLGAGSKAISKVFSLLK
ncbi:DUF4197 domain-containing protein [Undibacterium sp. TS12]|uniref:DUF4197 domain-containing protein n=1 Tax=Undibacterium sp. TS12 TaxID=2908202 RepID=UPI001F4C5DA2|nr:DUF4197 domain-containing protein [Undibacterium sp. TS12]MCH8617638.1 DUF4197 domain-containing protein [Undibacterium sp. TS12]